MRRNSCAITFILFRRLLCQSASQSAAPPLSTILPLFPHTHTYIYTQPCVCVCAHLCVVSAACNFPLRFACFWFVFMSASSFTSFSPGLRPASVWWRQFTLGRWHTLICNRITPLPLFLPSPFHYHLFPLSPPSHSSSVSQSLTLCSSIPHFHSLLFLSSLLLLSNSPFLFSPSISLSPN